MAKAGGFGAAMASAARDMGRAIGNALGIGGYASGAGGTTRSIGGDIAAAKSGSMIGRVESRGVGADARGENKPVASAPAVPVAPAAPAPTAPAVTTPVPPSAPAPVVPGDTTSTGAAEDAALESAKHGRASTIATGAQGLLAEDADQLRRRRSLVGGGLIQ